MRSHKVNEFSGSYDFALLPESREMPLIACDQVVCSGSVRTFEEHIVIRVACHFKAPGWNYGVTVPLDKLQQLLAKALANAKLAAAKHIGVFLKDGRRYVEARWFGNSQEEDCALKARRFYNSGNQDVCIDHQTEGNHQRFGFWDREALMIWSMQREVNLLVPLRSDCSPITLKTSGSGAASRT
jgi:hypothetical protein